MQYQTIVASVVEVVVAEAAIDAEVKLTAKVAQQSAEQQHTLESNILLFLQFPARDVAALLC